MLYVPDLTQTAKNSPGFPAHCPKVTVTRKVPEGAHYWCRFTLKWSVTDSVLGLELPVDRFQRDRGDIELAFDGAGAPTYAGKLLFKDAATDLKLWTRIGRDRGPGLECPALVESVEVKASRKTVTVAWVILVRLPDPAAVGQLYELLDCDVDVQTDRRQELLPWTRPADVDDVKQTPAGSDDGSGSVVPLAGRSRKPNPDTQHNQPEGS